MRIIIIDGYIDEPGCLGVPPYIAPHPRYIYGAIKRAKSNITVDYYTIDQIREFQKAEKMGNFPFYDILIIISGVSVPGKYLGGVPINYKEVEKLSNLKKFNNSLRIICGPATSYGIGTEGGKNSIPIENLNHQYHLILKGDPEIAIYHLLKNMKSHEKKILMEREYITKLERMVRGDNFEISDISIQGSEIIIQHPNFSSKNKKGNLICEIETFRGCPRYKSGGCSFCTEPLKGKTEHRTVDSIVKEVYELYKHGARHFRLGNQTDFYAYQHKDFINERYPQPNPQAIKQLFERIWKLCPEIKTLHIDNTNALNFSLYPKEAEEITKLIVKYCTSGNIAAIGVESVDPQVIKKNNLKCSKEEIEFAIKLINKWGRERGFSGLPKFLPGLNFIMGLPGETSQTLKENLAFLKSLLDTDLWLRRINLRKYLVSSYNENDNKNKKLRKHINKFTSKYFHWKKTIREAIDYPMLEKILPLGTLLRNVYSEQYGGGGTYCRQIATYPITCYVPQDLPLYQFYDLICVDYGFRSIVCLKKSTSIRELGTKQLTKIRGIGKKYANQILLANPKTKKEWLEIIPSSTYKIIRKII